MIFCDVSLNVLGSSYVSRSTDLYLIQLKPRVNVSTGNMYLTFPVGFATNRSKADGSGVVRSLSGLVAYSLLGFTCYYHIIMFCVSCLGLWLHRWGRKSWLPCISLVGNRWQYYFQVISILNVQKNFNDSNTDGSLTVAIHITKIRLFKYIENFISKNWKFSEKNSDIFHISAQNIDCGYSLEPPRRGSSNEYPQSMFWAEIRKIMYTPVNPSFTI